MLRISLIGAGNIKYHYFDLLKIPESDFDKQLNEMVKVLADFDIELVLLPDRGVCFELAKKLKQLTAKKVYGTVPTSDKDFGIKHLQSYIDAKINGKKIIDEILDTNNWYKQDLTHCIFGDIILMLGNSLGSLGELSYGYYLYKLFMGDKPGVPVMKNKIHSEVRAGEKLPFSVVIYMPFMKEKLNPEIEAYINRLKGKIYYINNPEELKSILARLISGISGPC